MTAAVHLETSLTFVTPKVMKDEAKPHINEETFADPGEHASFGDEELAATLRGFAMKEMSLVKVPVGMNGSAEKVEFFWLDVKKDKKAVQKLNKIMATRWVDLLWQFEKTREECGSDILSATLNDAAANIDEFLNLRRFLGEGTNPEVLKKGKRSVLLFHHSDANAPASD
jgi:hypothetical protein